MGGKASFADRLSLVMKALTISRGQLASDLGVDKSVVSRWLSGSSQPSEYNLARLTARISEEIPSFTMLDWDRDYPDLAAALGLSAESLPVLPRLISPAMVPDLEQRLSDLPDFARLPAFGSALHETAARGCRYSGLWRAWMPTVGHPDNFHCEHTALWQEGAWLVGSALGFSYRWPLVGYVANGQLLLVMSDASDFVLRQFNRADEPIIDQIDGLMLAAASLPHQAPTACRVIMQRVLSSDDREEIEQAMAEHARERRLLTKDDLPPEMAAALVPDVGSSACLSGGERLLRADPNQALMRTRWF